MDAQRRAQQRRPDADQDRLDALARRAGEPTQIERLTETMRRWQARFEELHDRWHHAEDQDERDRLTVEARLWGSAAGVICRRLGQGS